MPRAIIDLETRSACDLRKCGVYVYAEDPSTAITHFGYKIDDQPVRVWRPTSGAPMPNDLRAALSDPGVSLIAHNAGFERTVLAGNPGRAIGAPEECHALSRYDCTAARAAAVGLPRALERVCEALGLPIQKDKQGASLMARVCKPRSFNAFNEPIWWDDDWRMGRMDDYCARDVEVEHLLDRNLPHLSAAERRVWELTETINDRGLLVDRDLLSQILKLVTEAQLDLNKRIEAATGGVVPTVSNAGALRQWLIERGVEVAKGVDKAVVEALLQDDIDDLVRYVLEIRRDGGGSSSRKHAAIDRRLAADGRIRGELIYAGATSTGRWSSSGAQLQNLPRGGTINVDAVLRDLANDATLVELEDLHGPALKVASELLRPIFVAPPGYLLARGDYAQIEARVLAWLAGQNNVIEAFRAYDAKVGPDLYRVTAAQVFRVSVEEVMAGQRTIGKVATLALGFGGGKRAFQSMAKLYGVKVTDDRAEEIKLAWRAANPYITQFWYELNVAAHESVSRKTTIPVGNRGIQFRCNGRALALRLPSGRSLVYWQPVIKEVDAPWGGKRWAVCFHAQDSLTRKWVEFAGYGGIWTENVVQAVARDIMAHALLQLHDEGLNPVLTVHDEAACELPLELFPTSQSAADALRRVMSVPPGWADGLPTAVDASAAPRYMKG